MTDANTLVFELPEEELSTALAAFKLAHKEDADLRFAPDRAWIEGYTAASKTNLVEAPKSLDAEETRRTDVARAIWEVMREHEDRCDLSLDDIPASHQVWFCADAAISAQAAPVDAAVQQDAARLERERICAAIKAEDDYCVDHGDYMLDSDDCIKIVRGEWVRPDCSVDAARAAQGEAP